MKIASQQAQHSIYAWQIFYRVTSGEFFPAGGSLIAARPCFLLQLQQLFGVAPGDLLEDLRRDLALVPQAEPMPLGSFGKTSDRS